MHMKVLIQFALLAFLAVPQPQQVMGDGVNSKSLQENCNKNENVFFSPATILLLNIEQYLSGLDRYVKPPLKALHSFMPRVEDELRSLREDLTSLNSSVNDLNSKINRHDSKMERQDSRMQTSLETHTQQINALSSKLDTLTATTAQLSHTLQTNISDMEGTDSEESLELYESLQINLTHQLKSISDSLEHLPVHTCGGTDGWRRVVYLDMTDSSTTCPSGWQLTGYSKRTCGKVNTEGRTCNSAHFPVSGGKYTRVCGRIRAYLYGAADAFEAYDNGDVTTIDGAYVAGLSLTHGNPRQHIWTFAAGISETFRNRNDACPCDASIGISVPGFVGTDYFCESGRNSGSESTDGFYQDDPLWDGQGCDTSSTCCSFNTPPYFTKQFPTPTTDNIEARICQYDTGDDSPVELIELYVQ